MGWLAGCWVGWWVLQIEVGAPLYRMDTSVSDIPANTEATHDSLQSATSNTSAPTPGGASAGKELPAIVVDVPIMGESITTGSLASWMVDAGATVAADDVIAVIETDKVCCLPSTLWNQYYVITP